MILPSPHHSTPRPMNVGLFALILLLTFLLTLPPTPTLALANPQPVTAQAYLERTPLVVGQTTNLAIQLTIDRKYHLQSAQPLEDNLIPTKVEFSPAPGITIGTPRYPEHKILSAPGLSTLGVLAVYSGTIYIVIPITVQADAALGEQTLQFTARTQACDDKSCLPPSRLPVNLPVTIAAAGTVSVPTNEALFKTAAAQSYLPTATTVPAPSTSPVPATTISTPAPIPQPTTSSLDELAIINARNYHPNETKGSGAVSQPLWQLILLALAGGAIMNVMPCVLPVVPLKVLTLVQQAHGDRRKAIAHALMFATGIITLFVALAGLLGVLRLGGATIVYGQQFQSPIFLIAMSFIVLALALSMLGVWTINPPSALYNLGTKQTGYVGSFSMGLLATLLATPCSAPLLGSVLAWALIQPIVITQLIFALIGIGMAIPYVLLAAFPGGLDRLPKAGRWTELLKQFLGLVMVGVAIYLLLQLPVELWPGALFGALVLALVCWGWGQIPTLSMAPARVWTIRIVVLISGGLLAPVIVHYARLPASTDWQPFTVAALDQALAEKRPVIVDFTASWCINCRVVEARVLQNPTTKALFKMNKALLLRADISQENPPVQALMGKLDSRSIPVLAIFSPDAPLTPIVLRDLYSRQDVADALMHP